MNFRQDRLPHNRNQTETAIDEHCPSCLESLPLKVTECPACGIVLANFKRVSLEKKMKATVPGIHHLSSHVCEELNTAWKKLEAVYRDTELHHQFIHLCYKHRALPFAIKMYSDRLLEEPSDEVADLMRKRVLVLAQESLPTRVKNHKPQYEDHSLMIMRLFQLVFSVGCVIGLFFMMSSFFLGDTLYYFGLGVFILLSCLLSMFFIRKAILNPA